jgi:hypothetical protein
MQDKNECEAAPRTTGPAGFVLGCLLSGAAQAVVGWVLEWVTRG